MWYCKARYHGWKHRFNELMHSFNEVHYWQKSYSRDNGTIFGTSAYLPESLLLRCRLTVSLICKRIKGLRCQLIKTVGELGSDRCEAGWILSTWFVKSSDSKLDIVRKEKYGDATGVWVIRSSRLRSYAFWNKYWKHISMKSHWKIELVSFKNRMLIGKG